MVQLSNQCFTSNKIESENEELNEEEKNLVKLAIIRDEPHIIDEILHYREVKNPYMNIKKKQTLLHYLARHKSVQLFKTVSDKISDVFELDENNKFPIDIAAKKDHHEIVTEILYGKGAIMAREFHFGVDEPYMGYTFLLEALMTAGVHGNVQTFLAIINFLNGVNRSYGKSAQILTSVNSTRSTLPQEICEIIDQYLEFLNHETFYKKVISTHPMPKQLTIPMNDIIEKVIQIVYITPRDNLSELKKVDFVPIITTSMLDALVIIAKISNDTDENLQEKKIVESPRKFVNLLSYLEKVVHEQKKNFNDKFTDFLISTTYGNTIDFLDENQQQIFHQAEEELLNFGRSHENAVIDMIRYSKSVWGMIFPKSEIDLVLYKILIDDGELEVGLILNMVQSFLLSDSKSFLKFAKNYLIRSQKSNKYEL